MNFLLRLIVIAAALSHGTTEMLAASVNVQSAQVDAANKEKPASEIRKPVINSKPQPSYTKDARKSAVEGTVKLRVIFQSNGKIGKITVIEGLPTA
jgi:outer membrane biosynthesis protein TonB